MNTHKLKELIEQQENPKLEFKCKWYCGNNKLDEKAWGEFLKDLISLANGNLGYTDKAAYLIFGVDNEETTLNQLRKLHDVSNITKIYNLQNLRDSTLRRLKSVCSPSPPDIQFELILYNEFSILVIEIPPVAGIIKLDSDLQTRGLTFRKGTVLIRVGQDVVVADPTEISALEREIISFSLPKRLEIKKVLHNLPQRDYINFVGRKEELSHLRKFLHPKDRVWTIVIDGVGGIGKSALALEIAHYYLNEFETLPEGERFEAIMWISAKSVTLTADGIISRPQVNRSIDDIYKAIAICLEEDNITRVRFDEQNSLINRALIRKRTLLIIDNLETIDDERVNSFIRELPVPTKCIVTTRHRIDIAEPIRLTGMSKDDTLSLIAQECSKKNVQITQEEAELLFKRTGGVPLAVVWSVSQVAYGYEIQSVLHNLGNAQGDIAKFCFENAVFLIQEKAAYTLLVCICISTYINERKHLGQIANLSELDRDESLVTLEKLSLVNKQNGSYNVLPLVKEYIIAKLVDFPFNILKQIILRISEVSAGSGVDAIKLIEPFFLTSEFTELKNEVTHALVTEMYTLMFDYCDDFSAYVCVTNLARFDTKRAISELKVVVSGSLRLGWYSDNLYYAEQVAISALGRLGEIEFLVDHLAQGLFYSDYLKPLDVIQVIEEYGEIEVISKLDELITKLKDEEFVKSLNKAKEAILMRNKNNK